MRFFAVILIIIMLVTCVTEPPIVESQDTTRLYYIRELLQAKDSLSKIPFSEEVEKQKLTIDTLLTQCLNYKESAIDLIIAESQLKKAKISIRKYKNKIDTLNNVAENLRILLKTERSKNITLQAERDSVFNVIKALSPVKITGVEVYGLGKNSSIFFKERQYKTNISGRVKYICASMTIPENQFAKKEYKTVLMNVYSVDGKNYLSVDTSFNYIGKELKIVLSLKRNDFVSGNHRVNIFVNNEIQYETNFIIK